MDTDSFVYSLVYSIHAVSLQTMLTRSLDSEELEVFLNAELERAFLVYFNDLCQSTFQNNSMHLSSLVPPPELLKSLSSSLSLFSPIRRLPGTRPTGAPFVI